MRHQAALERGDALIGGLDPRTRDAAIAHGGSDDLVQLHTKVGVALLDVGEHEQIDAGVERSHHAILKRIVIAHRAHLHVVADHHAAEPDIALGAKRFDRVR